MPKNRLIYVGILVTGAAGLMWLAAEVLRRMIFFYPYAIGAGILLIVIGLFWEGKKGGKAVASLSEGASVSAPISEQDKVN